MAEMLATRTKKRCSPDRRGLPQVYMRARWYDPTLQRFISRDPLGPEVGANLYLYSVNDPANCIDPTGLVAVPQILAGLGIVGFFANKYTGQLARGDDQLIDSAITAIRNVPGYSGEADYIQAMHSRGSLRRIDFLVRKGGGKGLEGWTDPISDYVLISDHVLEDADCYRRIVMLATVLFHEAQHKHQKDRDTTFLARKGVAAYGAGDFAALKALEKPAYTAERQFLMDWLNHVPSSSKLSAPIQARLNEVNNRLSTLR